MVNTDVKTVVNQQYTAEEKWESLKSIEYATAKEVLGAKKRKHRDWFDENDVVIQQLFDDKHSAFKTLMQLKSHENRTRYGTPRNKC